jgi:hypothetical protein
VSHRGQREMGDMVAILLAESGSESYLCVLVSDLAELNRSVSAELYFGCSNSIYL